MKSVSFGTPKLLLMSASDSTQAAVNTALASKVDVVTVATGEAAWQQLLQDASISLVLCDATAPQQDGAALLERIRSANSKRFSVPVIMLTPADNEVGQEEAEAIRLRAQALGATDFICKPVNSCELLVRVGAHLHYQQEIQRLKSTAMLDSLTGMGNQRMLEMRLRQALSQSLRYDLQMVVLELQVDGFDALAADLGREKAARVVRQLGLLLRRRLRREDAAARVGAARFVVVLPCTNEEDAQDAAEDLFARIQATNFAAASDAPLTLPVSIGLVCPQPHPGQTVRKVLGEMAVVMGVLQQAGGMRILRDIELRGRNERLLPSPALKPTGTGKPPKMSLDDAVKALARGDKESVLAALPRLKRRLAPLLRLMAAARHNPKDTH